MVTHPANQKLHKTEFNSQEDWDTYPTADYCDKCSQIVSFNFTNLAKHQLSTFSNFNDKDKEAFGLFASTHKLEPTNSFLDFYCHACKRPVRIYYDYWAGGRHREHGFSMKYIVD
jgi:hypothetical protein